MSCIIPSCNNGDESGGTIVFVYVDFTEIEENSNRYGHVKSCIGFILDQMNVDTLEAGGGFGDVYIFPIYDFSSSIPAKVSLEKSGGFDENKLTRISIVRRFCRKLENALQSIIDKNLINTPTETYKESYILQPLCEGLEKLADYDPSYNKQVIIFSDMLENSNLFSFYGEHRDQIRNNPDILINELKEKFDLPDLSDISINVVYQPIKEKDFLITDSKRFWELFFLQDDTVTGIKNFSFDTYLESRVAGK